MKGLILAFVAAVVLLVAAGEASAHHGDVVIVRDQFGNVRAVNGGFHHGPRVVVAPRGFHNRSFFNQNGGRNRIGFRR